MSGIENRLVDSDGMMTVPDFPCSPTPLPVPLNLRTVSLPGQTHDTIRLQRACGFAGPRSRTSTIDWSQAARVQNMLRWTLVFLLIALVAGALGFAGLEGTAMWIAKVLFLLFLILFVLSLIMGRRGPRLP
jgi:uncharacterized membrane protein YtjA (UPF0391 family)